MSRRRRMKRCAGWWTAISGGTGSTDTWASVPPTAPELVIDTDAMSLAEAVDAVLQMVRSRTRPR